MLLSMSNITLLWIPRGSLSFLYEKAFHIPCMNLNYVSLRKLTQAHVAGLLLSCTFSVYILTVFEAQPSQSRPKKAWWNNQAEQTYKSKINSFSIYNSFEIKVISSLQNLFLAFFGNILIRQVRFKFRTFLVFLHRIKDVITCQSIPLRGGFYWKLLNSTD